MRDEMQLANSTAVSPEEGHVKNPDQVVCEPVAVRSDVGRGEADQNSVLVFANLCHELRTPLNAILGYTEILSDEFGGGCDLHMMRSAVDTIRRNGRHLWVLVNDILDFSKIEAGSAIVRQERYSPREVLCDVDAALAGRARAKGLDWQVVVDAQVPASVVGDAVRTRQVLLNLASNALKFTDRGMVRIEASMVRRGDATYLQMEIIDTGVGLTAEQQARMFQPFVQVATSADHRDQGSGLGLAISKSLATQLGGSLTVSSVPGSGSRFVFEIPVDRMCGTSVREEPARVAGPASDELSPAVGGISSGRPLAGMRVLIVEDSEDNRRLFERVFLLAGAVSTAVANGLAAVTAATNAERAGKPFDCILMDIHMPVVDGYEATRRIRKLGYDAPIVALTAATMPGDRERCLTAGCNEYISKPIDRTVFLGTVHNVVKAWHAHRTNVIS